MFTKCMVDLTGDILRDWNLHILNDLIKILSKTLFFQMSAEKDTLRHFQTKMKEFTSSGYGQNPYT